MRGSVVKPICKGHTAWPGGTGHVAGHGAGGHMGASAKTHTVQHLKTEDAGEKKCLVYNYVLQIR